jgi:hypothetical protein
MFATFIGAEHNKSLQPTAAAILIFSEFIVAQRGRRG